MKKKKGVFVFLSILIVITIGMLIYYLKFYQASIPDDIPNEPEITEIIPEKPAQQKPQPIKKPQPTPEETEETDNPEETEINIETEEPEEKAEEITESETSAEVITNKPLLIPFTRSLFHSPEINISQLPAGKVYHKSHACRIESIILSNEENEHREYLISYDCDGNKVDDLEIGLIDRNGKKIKHAILSQNKISTFILSEGKSGRPEETVTEYTISKSFHFVKGKTYAKVL